MSVLEVVMSRSSVRRFRPDPVPREALERILEAGLRAPTASAAEQWLFVAVTDPGLRGEIYRLLVEAHYRYALEVRGLPREEADSWRERILRERRYEAPAYVFSYLDLRERVCRPEWAELEREWALESLSAAMENMVLAALSLIHI